MTEAAEKKPAADIEQAKELLRVAAQLMREHRITELDVSAAGVQISMRTGRTDGKHGAHSATRDNELQDDAPAEPDDGVHVITAPMIGTFYVAPAPGEDPFVRPGDHVDEGQTIGIIEAMKIMNEIAADMSGEVIEVLAENGQTVEFGSPLISLRTP